MPTPTFEADMDFETDEGDKKLLVMFYMEAVKQEVASAEAGRPIFKDVPMIKILIPGSKDPTVQKVNENYIRRFPRQWERFQKQMEQIVDGTPLDQVPFLTVSQIAELKAYNCFTLEQLAGMSDQAGQKFMGIQSLKAKAQKYLDAANNAAPITHMQEQIDALKSQNEVLGRQLKEAMDLLAKVPAKAPAKA